MSMTPRAEGIVPSNAEEGVAQAVVVSEEDIQRKRLLMQFPKFKVIALWFQKLSGNLNLGGAEAAHKSLQLIIKELLNILIWGRKLKVMENTLADEQRTYTVLMEEQKSLAGQAESAILQQKLDLLQARSIQQWNQECEQLRHGTMAYPIKSGISSECLQLEHQILKLEADSHMLDSTLDMQKKQHALLMHCLEDVSFQS